MEDYRRIESFEQNLDIFNGMFNSLSPGAMATQQTFEGTMGHDMYNPQTDTRVVWLEKIDCLCPSDPQTAV